MMCDHKAQELASADPESAFFQVKAHVVFGHFSKYLFQVSHVLGYTMGFDDHVIDVDLDISSDLLFEDPEHQSMVYSACIFQAQGHDPIAEVGIVSN